MYTISGKVLVKETAVGIPNLQIVLYDLDPSFKDKLKALFNLRKEGGIWQSMNGERLGSVLTDENGKFELSFDESSFKSGEQKNGPDLLLWVLAPEEGEIPIEERVLHASLDIAANAGKKEAYIIRISQAKLDELQITVYKPVDTYSSASIKENIKKSYQFTKEIKEALKEETKEKIQNGLNIKKIVDTKLKNFTLSKVSADIRDSNLYLKPGEIVKDKQGKIIEDGLKEFQKEKYLTKRKVVLKLDKKKQQELGIPDEENFEGEISKEKLFEYLGPAVSGGTLENSFSSLKSCSKDSKARKLFEDSLSKCKDDAVVNPCKDPCKDQPANFVLEEHIHRQMQFATPPEQEPSFGIERNGKIIATINKPGPADNIAYHDFHSLEIAFENIWTEAFDPSLSFSVSRVFSEMVRYANRISGTDELPEIVDINDMRQLYEDYVSLNEIIEEEEQASDPVAVSVPPNIKEFLPDITSEDWGNMEDSDRVEIIRLANECSNKRITRDILNNPALIAATLGVSAAGANVLQSEMDNLRNQAKEIFLQSKRTIKETIISEVHKPGKRKESSSSIRLRRLMKELDMRLSEPHKFDIFAPNSINYGLMFTYRQTWVPKDYQVGELVSTLPLAPKEVRKYSTKKVIKKSRVQKEIEDNQSTRSSESTSTSRADAEIVKQAKNNTSFEMTTNATLSVGVVEGQFGTRLGIQAEKSSSDTKKNFREAVLKAAEEYKSQVRLEIETTTSEEFETTTSGEIMNPNEEITVTYLFYELQRQYEISEKLHQLTPVILVANEVPFPEEINEAWLIAHDWILQRVILDKSFLPALQYVTTSIAGDELALEILKDNVDRQVKLVEALTKQVETKTDLASKAFDELKRLMNVPVTTADEAAKLKDISMAIIFGPFSLAGGGDDDSAEKREEITKMAIERADKNVKEVNAKLATEVTALREAINKYTSALQEHFDRQTAIARLRIHVKANILYYMQAIWDYEPSDQRYFRLYNLNVPWIDDDNPTRTVRISRRRGRGSSPFEEISPVPSYHAELDLVLDELIIEPKKLHQVADLDNLLGFKGNYMIFPLKVNSYLHVYMMQDYINAETGDLRDPDEAGNYTTENILDYMCCLQKKNPVDFEENREALLNEFIKHQANPRKESDLVIVPTGSLYIEALPGEHPVLENFKLLHRALDVKKVQAEVRHAELENIRLASRLTEGDREDPDIDKKIIIEGTDSSNLNIETE